jgi:hypothetical protein
VPLEDEEEAIAAAAAAAIASVGLNSGPTIGYGAQPLLQGTGGFGTVTTAGGLRDQVMAHHQGVVTGAAPGAQMPAPQPRLTHSNSLDAAVAALAFSADDADSHQKHQQQQQQQQHHHHHHHHPPGGGGSLSEAELSEAAALRAAQVAAGRRLKRGDSDSFKRFLDHAIGSDIGSDHAAHAPEDEAELLAWLEQGGGGEEGAAGAR